MHALEMSKRSAPKLSVMCLRRYTSTNVVPDPPMIVAGYLNFRSGDYIKIAHILKGMVRIGDVATSEIRYYTRQRDKASS